MISHCVLLHELFEFGHGCQLACSNSYSHPVLYAVNLTFKDLFWPQLFLLV